LGSCQRRAWLGNAANSAWLGVQTEGNQTRQVIAELRAHSVSDLS
jgi:hypothetical protein